MRDGRPLAQKWDEENCEPQLLLHRLCKGLRENDGNLSQKHPEAFHFQRKSNPIAPFEMASGLLQVSSPCVEKRLPWSHVRFMGRRAKAFTDSIPIGAFALAKRR